MENLFAFDRIQLFSVLFSLFIFFFIFWLVKHRKFKEEYSILWFATSLVFLYMSLDRYAVDRIGELFGIAYRPTIILLIIAAFMTLVLVHITVALTRLSDQNKELIQELGLGRLSPVPERADLLIIVPAYNEAQAIGQVICDLRKIDREMDILVVNDGSADSTSAEARATGQALVIDLPKNLGIGGAVQTGFKYAARNGYLSAIQFDGDGQHLAGEIPKLLAIIDEGQVNMVIGSRFLNKQDGYRSTLLRRQGIRLFATLNSLLIGQRVTDNTSGFRAYDRRAIEFLAMHYPVDYPEPEAVILLGRNHFKIAEVATAMQERQGGGSSITGVKGAYYMTKVILAIIMTALRKPLPVYREAGVFERGLKTDEMSN